MLVSGDEGLKSEENEIKEKLNKVFKNKHASLAASEDFKLNRGEKWGYQIVYI